MAEMKKLFLFLMIFSLSFSCSLSPFDITISNESSKNVSFTVFGDDTVYSLNPGQTIIVESKIKTPEITFLTNDRIFADYNYKDGGAVIKDMLSWDITFYNSTKDNVSIIEKNDLLNEKGSIVSVNSESEVIAKIYTNQPSFIITKDSYYYSYTLTFENDMFFCRIY